MKTKKSDKAEESVEQAAPVAAKPLSKPAAAAKPAVKKVKKAPLAEPVKTVKVAKKPKLKVVRDSFTMPQSEYLKIAEIKELCLKAGLSVKKSEVLRAGLRALAGMDTAQLKRAMAGVEKIKTGRPKKA